MTIKEIKNKPWVYRLYSTTSGYIISVSFNNSFVDFSRCFSYEFEDISEERLTEFSKEVVENYELYKILEIELPSEQKYLQNNANQVKCEYLGLLHVSCANLVANVNAGG